MMATIQKTTTTTAMPRWKSSTASRYGKSRRRVLCSSGSFEPLKSKTDASALKNRYPQNDSMIKAAKGRKVSKTPTDCFVKPGEHCRNTISTRRYGKEFLQLLEDPEDVCEVTMQPVRRYKLDAAILFSDILVIAEAMNVDVEMPGGKGVVIEALQAGRFGDESTEND